MKHYDFKILINNEETTKARRWCREHFGELKITVKQFKRRYKTNPMSYTCYRSIYDLEQNIWYNKIGGNPRAFYFKNIVDATAFKLRWI